MKKQKFLVLVCLIGIWITACVKESETIYITQQNAKSNSTATILIRMKNAGFGGSYLMATTVGHKSTDCGGKCKFFNGRYYHSDCQGTGNVCNYSASVIITKNIPDDITDVYYTGIGIHEYEPIEDETFSMPARSFYIKDESFENGFIWINVPNQELIRDVESRMFVYKDITFTNDPLFENL